MARTQKARILVSLQRVGDAGTCETELYNQHLIRRIAARIYDLKKDGYLIDSKRCPHHANNHAHYTLRRGDAPTLF